MKLVAAFIALAAIGLAQLPPPCPPLCPKSRTTTEKPVKKPAPKPRQ